MNRRKFKQRQNIEPAGRYVRRAKLINFNYSFLNLWYMAYLLAAIAMTLAVPEGYSSIASFFEEDVS